MIRRMAAAALAGLLCAAIAACGDDDPTQPTNYTITIVNNDSVSYYVWIDDNADQDPDTIDYVQEDLVEANDTLVLTDRALAVFYDICLATDGQNPNPPDEEFIYNTLITSNGPNITWTVPPDPEP